MIPDLINNIEKYRISNNCNHVRFFVHSAVQCGHVEMVKCLLGMNMLNEKNIKDSNGDTPLHIAIKRNDIKMIDLLLHCKFGNAMLEVQDKDRNTPFNLSILQNNLTTLKRLFSLNNNICHDMISLLRIAVNTDNIDIDIVKYLLSLSLADSDVVNCKYGRNDYLMHDAVRKGNIELVEYLAGQSAKVDMVINGKSPLLIAIKNKDKNMVTQLLKCNASINAVGVGFWNVTPLMRAVYENDASMVKLLLSNEAKADILCNNGASLIFMATAEENFEIVKMLVDNKFCSHINTPYCGLCDSNVLGRKNFLVTPLCMAVDKNNLKLATYLLDHGADLDIKVEKGVKKLLSIAIKNENKDMLKLLLDHDKSTFMGKGFDITNLAVKAEPSIDLMIWLINNKYCDIHNTKLANYVKFIEDKNLITAYHQEKNRSYTTL